MIAPSTSIPCGPGSGMLALLDRFRQCSTNWENDEPRSTRRNLLRVLRGWSSPNLDASYFWCRSSTPEVSTVTWSCESTTFSV